MRDLRAKLEQIMGTFISAVLTATRSVSLAELAAEAKMSRVGSTREPTPRRASSRASAAVTGKIPRGVRGAPTSPLRAIEWQRQLESGQVRSRADIARREGLTRARVTQIMNLLRDGRLSERVAYRRSATTRKRGRRTSRQ
jgi:hypothetical protein